MGTEPDGPAVLDELVPRPGSPLRTLAVAVVLAGLAVLAIWATATGRVTPLLQPSSAANWGGEGPVRVAVAVHSGSDVDLEIVDGFGEPPGLRLLGYTVGVVPSDEPDASDLELDPFPVRLAAGRTRWLGAHYEVTDCDLLERTTDPDLAVTVRIADGPFGLVERRRSAYELIGPDDDPADPSGWPAALATSACGGSSNG